jgi:hypothetical protein
MTPSNVPGLREGTDSYVTFFHPTHFCMPYVPTVQYVRTVLYDIIHTPQTNNREKGINVDLVKIYHDTEYDNTKNDITEVHAPSECLIGFVHVKKIYIRVDDPMFVGLCGS